MHTLHLDTVLYNTLHSPKNLQEITHKIHKATACGGGFPRGLSKKTWMVTSRGGEAAARASGRCRGAPRGGPSRTVLWFWRLFACDSGTARRVRQNSSYAPGLPCHASVSRQPARSDDGDALQKSLTTLPDNGRSVHKQPGAQPTPGPARRNRKADAGHLNFLSAIPFYYSI